MKKGVVIGFAASLMLTIGLLYGANVVKGEQTLQGTWKLSAGEANGTPLSKEQLQDGDLVIQGDRYRVTLDGKGTVTGVQKLDSASTIKTIDITNDSGPHKGQTCLGIYELKGDEFRVAFAPPGKPRLSKFSTTPDSGQWMHLWNRVQK